MFFLFRLVIYFLPALKIYKVVAVVPYKLVILSENFILSLAHGFRDKVLNKRINDFVIMKGVQLNNNEK